MVMNQFLAWLHPDSSLHPARAPAEVMLLKSKPHFTRCRELKTQASRLSFVIDKNSYLAVAESVRPIDYQNTCQARTSTLLPLKVRRVFLSLHLYDYNSPAPSTF